MHDVQQHKQSHYIIRTNKRKKNTLLDEALVVEEPRPVFAENAEEEEAHDKHSHSYK